MKLNNIALYNNPAAFSGNINKTAKEDSTMDDKIIRTATALTKVFSKDVENYVPENNTFTPVYRTVELPCDKEVKFVAEYDKKEPINTRRFYIGVSNKHSDEIAKKYLFKGTKNELVDFLKDSKNVLDFYEVIKELSNL